MDKDRVVESAKKIKGAVEQMIGKAIGDASWRRTARPTR